MEWWDTFAVQLTLWDADTNRCFLFKGINPNDQLGQWTHYLYPCLCPEYGHPGVFAAVATLDGWGKFVIYLQLFTILFVIWSGNKDVTSLRSEPKIRNSDNGLSNDVHGLQCGSHGQSIRRKPSLDWNKCSRLC